MLFLAGSLYFLVVPVTWKPLYGEIERISYPGCSYVVSRHSQPKNPYSDSSDYYSVLVDLEVSNLGDLNAYVDFKKQSLTQNLEKAYSSEKIVASITFSEPLNHSEFESLVNTYITKYDTIGLYKSDLTNRNSVKSILPSEKGEIGEVQTRKEGFVFIGFVATSGSLNVSSFFALKENSKVELIDSLDDSIIAYLRTKYRPFTDVRFLTPFWQVFALQVYSAEYEK